MLLTGTMPTDALYRVARRSSTGVDPLKPANLLRREVPAAVAEALQRAMSLSSADRFETVEEFWQVLQAHTTDKQVEIPRVTSVVAYQPLPLRASQRTMGAFYLKGQDILRSGKRKRVVFVYATLLVTFALGTALLSHLFGPTALLLLVVLLVILALIPLLR